MERRIEATASTRADLSAVTAVLSDPVEVVGRPGEQSGSYRGQVVAALRDGTSVRQDVVVRIGAPELSADVVRWTLGWRPAGRERALPAFQGRIEVEADPAGGTRLRVSGVYRPPLGPIGALADTAGLKNIARNTLERFTDDVAAGVDRIVDSRRGRGWVAGPLPDDLRPLPSEHWLG